MFRILYSSHELQVVPVGGEVKDHVITIMSSYDVIIMTSSLVTLTIDMHDLFLNKSTEVIRFELLIAAFNFLEISDIPFSKKMQHSIFNLLVANNRLLSAAFNFHLLKI